ncbi:isochorismatase family protein [Paenibacillus protaetiae]|uniref:Isochorismatase family protein n=1 Tax=Paenibacillus protaetiae TaxID=2509456 RepID=A0A4P6F1P0_9BACL|nr:isochorismatase family protein [Paenibacillus protaetiae]QAY66967.1 isochorismatase family protein [Paenibacillus protaetiae]
MQALLVIDVQNGIVEAGDFREELSRIEQCIQNFQASGNPVLFIRHMEDDEDSPLYRHCSGSELHSSVSGYAEHIIVKQTPDSFHNTSLAETLQQLGADHLFITGFETEFCCMFTAIAAFDRGYKVTFISDATDSCNTAETYGMEGLNIRGFVSKVLGWSGTVEVVSFEQYTAKYGSVSAV